MQILDENGVEISTPDLNYGYLKNDTNIVHHKAIVAVEEQSHVETLAEYENGGIDVCRIVDVPGVSPCDAWEESIPVLRYVLYTQAQLDAIKIDKINSVKVENDRIYAQATYTAMMTDTLLPAATESEDATNV